MIALTRCQRLGRCGFADLECICEETPMTMNSALDPYASTTAKQFAPGNFVTTWNPALGRAAVGVTRAIEDVQEANPRVLVKWLHDLSEEWVRAEYLNLAN